MQHVERHFLYKVLNGDKAHVEREDQKLFSIEFVRYNNLINEMREINLDLNQDNIELYAQMHEVYIDPNFPKLSISLNGDTQQIIDLYIEKKKRTTKEQELKNLILNNKLNDPETQKKVQQLMEELRPKTIHEPKTFQDVLPEQIQFVRDILDGKEADGVYLYRQNKSRQFMKLSYMLKYIADTDLVLIGGRPSVGKTSFLLSLMNVFSKNGYKGLMFSLEMTTSQVMHRMATAKSGVTRDKLFDLKEPDPNVISSYFTGLSEIAKLPITTVDDPVSSWMEMKQTIIANKDNIDYVVIDHFTYIPSYDTEDVSSGHLTYSKIIRDIKQTAKEYKIPIILLAQFSRSMSSGAKRVDDRYLEPFMRDFRETGSIEEYADKILLLYRKEDKEAEQFNRFRIACKIEKNRAGRTGVVEYMFYAGLNRWKEVEND